MSTTLPSTDGNTSRFKPTALEGLDHLLYEYIRSRATRRPN